MKLSELQEFISSTSSEEKELKDEKKRTLWNIIFNYAVARKDKRDCENEIERYSSLRKVLEHNMKQGENIKYARA